MTLGQYAWYNIYVTSKKDQNTKVTLPNVSGHNFGSNGQIFKIQLLLWSELLHAAIFCDHRAEFAIHKNKTHAKIKRFTVSSPGNHSIQTTKAVGIN